MSVSVLLVRRKFWQGKDESLGDLEDLSAPDEIARAIKSDLQNAIREFENLEF